MGLSFESTRTQAFWSKWTVEPSARRMGLPVRMTTAVATDPFLMEEVGDASLIATADDVAEVRVLLALLEDAEAHRALGARVVRNH